MKKNLTGLIGALILLFIVTSQVYGYGHTVMVRVVHITPSWIPYASTDGWTQAVSIKESSSLKYFEIAIWEETSSIHLYEFPNDYDPSYGQSSGISDQDKIDYREQFSLRQFPDMPDEINLRSEFIRDSFQSFIDIIISRYPDSNYALTFSGHGGPGGALFAGNLAPKHSQDLLYYWVNKIQSKLAFIDMGGPCNKGGYSDLNAFCPFSEYYIASDMPNGGYNFDDWTIEKYNETNPDYRYHDLIADNEMLLGVLEGRIDLKRQAYEYSLFDMTANKVEQANYLYSCNSFKNLYEKVEPIASSLPPYEDLLSHLEGYGDSYVSAFHSTIAYRADNRDFFTWEKVRNGILTPNTLYFNEELLELSYPNISSSGLFMTAIIDFFDESVDTGLIVGDGPGKSADKRLNALRNMIETAAELISIEDFEGACGQLHVVLRKCDGIRPPPDFVSGEAVFDLYEMIVELLEKIVCE